MIGDTGHGPRAQDLRGFISRALGAAPAAVACHSGGSVIVVAPQPQPHYETGMTESGIQTCAE